MFGRRHQIAAATAAIAAATAATARDEETRRVGSSVASIVRFAIEPLSHAIDNYALDYYETYTPSNRDLVNVSDTRGRNWEEVQRSLASGAAWLPGESLN